MKKHLVLLSFLITITASSQNFWTQYATSQPITSTGIRSISIVNENVTWLNMSCGTTGCNPIRRYAKTSNGGTQWTTGTIDLGPDSSNLEIYNIQGISSTVAFACVSPKTFNVFGGIWKTIDGGTTWARQDSALFNETDSFSNEVYFWNANEGVVIGDPTNGYFEIYTTTNGGDTWTRVPASPALIPIDPQEFCEPNVFTVNGNTIWAYTKFGRLLKSADRGINWTVSQTPIPDFGGGINGVQPPDLAFSDENNGLLQNSDYSLYSTQDGGVTWATIPYSSGLRNFGIAAVPGMPNTYISLGEDLQNFERGSSFSIDGGLSWVNINNNPDTDFVRGGEIEMLNENYGFASDFSNTPTEGGIHRWGGGPLLRLAHLAVTTFSGDKSITVAPNPTSGSLKIVGKNINQIVVTDLLGKQMITADYSAVNNATLDMNALPNGIYLVKITNEIGTTTAKIIKQ